MMARSLLALACTAILTRQIYTGALTVTPNVVSEDAGTAVFNVTGFQTDAGSVVVNTSSTAIRNVDYNIPKVVFAIIGPTYQLSIEILQDQLTEPDETITLDFNNDAGNYIDTITVTIEDVPPPPPPPPPVTNNDTSAFDCNRPGQSCANDTDNCTVDSHACQCGPGKEGVDCSIVTADIDGAGCDSHECVNGVCVSTLGSPSCACPPEFYGEACDIPYVSVKCFPEYMIVFFKPVGSFNGRFAVEDFGQEPACVAEAIPDPSGDDIDVYFEGMYLKINYTDSPCGNFTPKEEGDVTSREAHILLQHIPNLITGRDQRFLARCYFNRNNHVVQGEAFSVSGDVDGLDEEEVSNVFAPIQLGVTANGDPADLSTPVELDTEICVSASVPQDHGAIEINKVMFNSSNDGTPYEWVIYEDGCDDEAASAVHFKSPYYKTPKYDAEFCFKMFYLKPSGEFSVWVTVSTCLDEDECDMADCVARKKRQVEERTEERRRTEAYQVVFVVRDPAEETANKGTAAAGTPDEPSGVQCDGLSCQTYFVPMVCGLVVLCVALLVLAAILLAVRRRRRSKEDDA